MGHHHHTTGCSSHAFPPLMRRAAEAAVEFRSADALRARFFPARRADAPGAPWQAVMRRTSGRPGTDARSPSPVPIQQPFLKGHYPVHVQSRTASRSSSRRSHRPARGGGPRRAAALLAAAAAAAPRIESLEARQLFSVPNGPYALTATPTGAAQASLHWYDSAGDATGYRVAR